MSNALPGEPLGKLAITMGDPAGIGPEIIVKAFAQSPELLADCFVAGDVGTMVQAHARWTPQTPMPRVRQCCEPPASPIVVGKVQADAGRIAAECVVWAAKAALHGDIAALVTAPLHKEAMHMAGSRWQVFPGHTELLQSLAAEHLGVAVDEIPVRMMLANDELRVVLVSIHESLRHAIDRLTTKRVLDTLRITHQSLSKSLRRAPQIAVAGLNPHAGEGGLFGREEIELIAPAIEMARSEGLRVSGPYAPDTVFMRARRKLGSTNGEFDVVVAMYHDQGLIPVKYLGVDEGVNVTLGLPLVRTSPDHGTAFDIAGQGVASPQSLLAAIRMARQLAATPR